MLHAAVRNPLTVATLSAVHHSHIEAGISDLARSRHGELVDIACSGVGYAVRIHVLDDPKMSTRVARFLAARAERQARTPEVQLNRSACAVGPQGPLAAVPDDLLAAAVAFEERYGGLTYRLGPGRNPMEYGLDGVAYFFWIPKFGWAMPAAVDGAWTLGVDLLLDGRWYDGDSAVHVTLKAWPDGQDHWILRCFARRQRHLSQAPSLIGVRGEPAEWCSICCRFLQPIIPHDTPQGRPGMCLPPASPDGWKS